jgi:hypothetical protein
MRIRAVRHNCRGQLPVMPQGTQCGGRPVQKGSEGDIVLR